MLKRRIARAALHTVALVASVMAISTTAIGASGGQMVTGGLTSQPIGHFDFCKRYPTECAVRSTDLAPMPFTSDLWTQVTTINARVNAAIAPMSDLEVYGREEYWAYPTNVGDCEDYALEKRRLLMDQGFPVSTLLMTVVRKPDGEGHAVLTVRTDKGDFILDNLSEQVLLWNQTGYRYLKRQARNHSGRWVTIRGGTSSPLVGAVRSTSD